MGSYRRYVASVSVCSSYEQSNRGKETCGDIDILITRPNDDRRTHAGVYLPLHNRKTLTLAAIGVVQKLLNHLHEYGIITEDLSIPDNWYSLELVYRGLCRKDSDSPHRRIGM